jgi:hypothetical protein
MIAEVDYVGLAALVTAFFGGIAALIAAVMATRSQKLSSETHTAVATPPGADTIGQIAADVQKAVNGGFNTGQVPVVPPGDWPPPPKATP